MFDLKYDLYPKITFKEEHKEMTESEIKEIALKAVKEALEQAKDNSNDKWFMQEDCEGVYTIMSGVWPKFTKIESWAGNGNKYDCFTSWDKIGNIFETREEAAKALAWLEAFKTLREDAKGYKFVYDESNYYVDYEPDDDELSTDSDEHYQSKLIYFESEEDAKESIKKHGKEWLIFLGVEG